jgi:hypothetical protein
MATRKTRRGKRRTLKHTARHTHASKHLPPAHKCVITGGKSWMNKQVKPAGPLTNLSKNVGPDGPIQITDIRTTSPIKPTFPLTYGNSVRDYTTTIRNIKVGPIILPNSQKASRPNVGRLPKVSSSTSTSTSTSTSYFGHSNMGLPLYEIHTSL